MAFCSQCGAEAAGNFCPRCGATVGVAGAAAGGAQAGFAPPPVPPVVESAGLTQNVASALCYLFGLITGIIFLVLAPYNQNKVVRFHAFQSIFLHLSFIIAFILLGILSGIMALATHCLSFIFSGMLYPLLLLCMVGLWLYMMYSAYNNKMVVLPVIGPLAQKQA
jgi:uncharacterized membrane protein